MAFCPECVFLIASSVSFVEAWGGPEISQVLMNMQK